MVLGAAKFRVTGTFKMFCYSNRRYTDLRKVKEANEIVSRERIIQF